MRSGRPPILYNKHGGINNIVKCYATYIHGRPEELFMGKGEGEKVAKPLQNIK